jgi:hypothetical protein
MSWRKRRKTLLIISGILYVTFGILAFFNVPGQHDEHHHTVAHNLTHIILGLLLLTLTVSFPPAWRQWLCYGFALAYFAIAACGGLVQAHSTLKVVPGVIEFHVGDYGVHLATGFYFLTLAILKRSDAPRGGGFWSSLLGAGISNP